MGERYWGCRDGGDRSFRVSLPTLRGLDTIWRAERMRSGVRSFPLASGEDGSQEAGPPVGRPGRRPLPAGSRGTWIRVLEARGEEWATW